MSLDNPFWEIVQKFPQDSWMRMSRRPGKFTPSSDPAIDEYISRAITSARMSSARMSQADQDAITKGLSRSKLVHQYSWAIPRDDTIEWLGAQLMGREFIEIGAGVGYWGFLLNQIGIPVLCYDESLISQGEKNNWFDADAKVWHPVFRGGPEMVKNNADKVLFLCWPYMNDMAYESLIAYEGDTVIFIGENEGGCCATDDFFRELEKDWFITAEHDVTQWSGMHDYLTIYTRTPIIQEEP